MERKKFTILHSNKVYINLVAIIMIIMLFFQNASYAHILSDVAKKIDTQAYKTIIETEIPLIGTVYNNGNISTSLLSNELNDLIRNIFSFDMNDPISVLNAESSALYRYYMLEYRFQRESNFAQDSKNGILNIGNGGLKTGSSSISLEDVEIEEYSSGNLSSSGEITFRNETKNKIDVDELLKEDLKFNFDKKKDKILIYHTHTTESYLTDISQLNKTVSTRSTDLRNTVARVGEELAENLRNSYGMQVIHNVTVHDYPNYNLSYANSLKTVTAILKAYSNTKIVIDLHRDAVSDQKKLREVTTVDGKNAAKIMFVVATGERANNHPTWKENLKLALKIQKELNKQSPNLTLPMLITKYTYNQHLTNGALLIEIGGDGNLMSECLESTKYLSKAINEAVK